MYVICFGPLFVFFVSLFRITKKVYTCVVMNFGNRLTVIIGSCLYILGRIIIIIVSKTMFMVLSSLQSNCESSPGSFDNCRTAPIGRRPKTKPDDLGYESACTGCRSLHPPFPFDRGQRVTTKPNRELCTLPVQKCCKLLLVTQPSEYQ